MTDKLVSFIRSHDHIAWSIEGMVVAVDECSVDGQWQGRIVVLPARLSDVKDWLGY